MFVIKPKQKKAIWLTAFPEQIEIREKKVKLKKLQKPIKPRTSKRANQEAKCNRRVFQWKQENKFCRNCGQPTQECHHRFGRKGLLLMLEKEWIPVCSNCHLEIHKEPDWARSMGLLRQKGHYNNFKQALEYKPT